ncbi:squalene/phytoene synthase family protein [Streptomyces kunmingensis]|uniref:Squalene/phytoene synthase family protein n=1 Tax=Streptomyces kunmingensis TaxID=68225 RepID=A0ABU6CGE3_9ACTN|nr:squalene/phytoene synthase family protein [Streptomyces kunmingensis]MEB3963197.1 squalene/phytoene synthase family protein [Streptomyces kunmingensis]
MPTWKKTLRAAGIRRADLHADYSRQRDLVKAFAKKEYLAVRLLLPPALHPPVIAAVAFMHATDELIDTGDAADRKNALAQWAEATRAALGEPAAGTDATLRTLADTVTRHPGLRPRVEAFLTGAHLDVDYTGFRSEEQLQEYVTGYSLPAFMLMAGFVAPACTRGTHGDQAAFEAGCRALIESMQRVDWLDDLAEDAANGVVGVPQQDLDRHQLTVADIAQPTDSTRRSLAELVQEQTALAQDQLRAAGRLPQLVAPATQPFVTALCRLQHLKLAAVRQAGGDLADGGAEVALPAVLRTLIRQYRAASRTRTLAPQDPVQDAVVAGT